MWKGIDTVVNNKNKKPADEIFLNESGKLISDTKHVADTVNTYFVNVAQKLVSNMGNSNTKYQDYLKNPNESSLFLIEINHNGSQPYLLCAFTPLFKKSTC